jgi:hypothetical protein
MAGKILDYNTSHSRTIRYQLGSLDMGINYGAFSGQARFITINGKVPARPVWQATGLPAERLPFLNAAPAPNPLDFPFRHLGVAAVPQEPWHIFSRTELR